MKTRIITFVFACLYSVSLAQDGGGFKEVVSLANEGKHKKALDALEKLMEDEPDTTFVMGSGSTVGCVMEALGLENTLLGVDVVRQGELIARDVTAEKLLSLAASGAVKIVLTVIGGQGHILGRGNQQLSAELIRRVGKDNLMVVATKQKLQSLEGRPLRLDSGDPSLDKALAGPTTVITGYKDKVLYPAQ